MISHSDTHNRTLHYVDVIYLSKGKYDGRKHAHYPEQEAVIMFQRTINKFKEEKKEALICLREENHSLIKSEKV